MVKQKGGKAAGVWNIVMELPRPEVSTMTTRLHVLDFLVTVGYHSSWLENGADHPYFKRETGSSLLQQRPLY